jgi:hypothetical protein
LRGIRMLNLALYFRVHLGQSPCELHLKIVAAGAEG